MHGVFKNLNINEIKEDILKAQELLKSHLGYYPSHFAYPFGSINEVGKNHFQIPKELNFKTATTTRYGPIYKIHKNYMHSLPRIMLSENFVLESASCIRRKLIDLS